MKELPGLKNASSQLLGSENDLIVKGEGGANVVVQYKNSKNQAQVIRLRKSRLNGEKQLQDAGIDEIIWPELKEKGASLLSLQSDLVYIKDILTPLVGSQYISSQELITFNEQETQTYGASQGVLMPDVTLLPFSPSPAPPPLPSPSKQPLSSTVSIEIKPKYGAITKCSTVRPDDVVLKHSTSRYQLHQFLKQDQGTIDTVSSYDPLDLFSKEAKRIEKALNSLLDNPQNNLNIFIDGQPMNLGSAGSGDGDGDELEIGNLLEMAINIAATALLPHLERRDSDNCDTNKSNNIHGCTSEVEEWSSKKYLVLLLRLILQQEPVLDNIRNAQQACHVDIEGIYLLYQKLLQERGDERKKTNVDTKERNFKTPSLENGQKTDDKTNSLSSEVHNTSAQHNKAHEAAIAALVQLPRQDIIEILKSYIIAATAKDCSIMITMKSLGSSNSNRSNNNIRSLSPNIDTPSSLDNEKEEESTKRLQTTTENGKINVDFPPPRHQLNDHPHSNSGGRDSKSECSIEQWSVEYRISVVDLDRKSTLKIPKHYELDQAIMLAAKKQLKK